MNEDTLNIDGTLLEEALQLRSVGVVPVVGLLSIVIVDVDEVNMRSDEEAETEERLALDERVHGRGKTNGTYRSVLLNGSGIFALLDVGTVAAVAEDEVRWAVGTDGSFIVLVGIEVISVSFFAVPSNFDRRLEAWVRDGPAVGWGLQA